MESEWKPELNWDGSTSYVAEEGDTAQTLVDQYSEVTSLEQAQSLIGTDDIVAGQTEVSGQAVHNMFNNNGVLRLDLNSSRATDQRVIDHYVYAGHHATSKGASAFTGAHYFGNIFDQSLASNKYQGKICADGSLTDFTLNIKWYRNNGSIFNSTSYALTYEINAYKNYDVGTSKDFGGKRATSMNFRTYFYKSEFARKAGTPTRTLWAETSINTVLGQGAAVSDALSIVRPNYNYVNTKRNDKK